MERKNNNMVKRIWEIVADFVSGVRVEGCFDLITNDTVSGWMMSLILRFSRLLEKPMPMNLL